MLQSIESLRVRLDLATEQQGWERKRGGVAGMEAGVGQEKLS